MGTETKLNARFVTVRIFLIRSDWERLSLRELSAEWRNLSSFVNNGLRAQTHVVLVQFAMVCGNLVIYSMICSKGAMLSIIDYACVESSLLKLRLVHIEILRHHHL